MSGLGGNVIVGLGGSNAPNPCGATSCQAARKPAARASAWVRRHRPASPRRDVQRRHHHRLRIVVELRARPGLLPDAAHPGDDLPIRRSVRANGQFILCTSTGACPRPRHAAASRPGLGLCLPASAPCPRRADTRTASKSETFVDRSPAARSFRRSTAHRRTRRAALRSPASPSRLLAPSLAHPLPDSTALTLRRRAF